MKQTESAGGVVINQAMGKILVVNQHGRSWSLPKGHIDPGEDALQAAQREIREESGLHKLVMIKSLGSYQRHKMGQDNHDDSGELKTIHMYLFTTDQNILAPEDKDNPEARWVDPNSVAELLTHRKDKEFYLRIKNELTYFL